MAPDHIHALATIDRLLGRERRLLSEVIEDLNVALGALAMGYTHIAVERIEFHRDALRKELKYLQEQ